MAGGADFREMLARYPGLRALPKEQLVKAVYLRDRRTLPDGVKRLFDTVTVVRVPVEEPEDVARAIDVANGEVAAVNLGLSADTLHYVRTRLAMEKDREVTVSWSPRLDALEGEVLPQLDGFELDLRGAQEVEVNQEYGVARCGMGATWKRAYDACRSQGWLFPLLPPLPVNPFIGDVLGGSALLTSYGGGADQYLRNVDFVGPDGVYSQSGFDGVPNSAAGYDLNALMLVMGHGLGIPLSATFTLAPAAEDAQSLRYPVASTEELVGALEAVEASAIRPLSLLFGDDTGSRVSWGAEGTTLTLSLHGTEETLPHQVQAVDAAFGEEPAKEVMEGQVHPLERGERRRPPAPLGEILVGMADLPALLEALTAWQEERGPAFGWTGSLTEGGTVSLVPFHEGPMSRGERFDRLYELVLLARKQPGRLRATPVLQLLETETDVEQRFALARRIKGEVDLPNVVNPSSVLWVPRG